MHALHSRFDLASVVQTLHFSNCEPPSGTAVVRPPLFDHYPSLAATPIIHSPMVFQLVQSLVDVVAPMGGVGRRIYSDVPMANQCGPDMNRFGPLLRPFPIQPIQNVSFLR